MFSQVGPDMPLEPSWTTRSSVNAAPVQAQRSMMTHMLQIKHMVPVWHQEGRGSVRLRKMERGREREVDRERWTERGSEEERERKGGRMKRERSSGSEWGG